MNTLRFLTCAGLIAGLGSVAIAQDPASKLEPKSKPAQGSTNSGTLQTPAGTTQVDANGRLLRMGNELVGASVVSPTNEPLGRIEELVIHPRGDIAYVQISGAGDLSTTTQHYPVPWRALARRVQGQYVLDATPQAFAAMPAYETRPALSDTAYWGTVDRAYGKLVTEREAESARERVGTTEASAPRAALAPAKTYYTGSDFKTRTIETPEGDKIATVREVVLDPRFGRVSYVVLALNDASGTNGRVIAIPWDVLKTMPDKADPKAERWTLAATREKLASAPEFVTTADGWNAESQLPYVQRVYEYYATPAYWSAEKREPGMDSRPKN